MKFTRLVACLVLLVSAPAWAQNQGRLLVTVVDQSRAVIPGATVTVTGLDEPTRGAALEPVQTSTQGLATVGGLVPGRYSISAVFTGFEARVLADVRVRAGDNRHVVVLAIQRIQDSVTVGQDPQAAAADRRGTLFGSTLTREQIDALSDDPDEMKRQLQDMGGPGAVIRVDSFEGGALPAKAQIKSIHITRDAFAAENHNAGGLFIDIITQPGVGRLRGGTNWRIRSGSLSGRSPFTPEKGPEHITNYGLQVGGSLIPQRSSFSLAFNGQRSYDTANLNAALPGQTLAHALSITTPRNNDFVNGLFDYAITPDQTVRVSYNQTSFANENIGIGAYDLPERAYSTAQHNHTVRIQEAGPLGRRFFTNTRLQIGWNDSESQSAFEIGTIRVNDAFTSGGQQVAGGSRARTFNLASDLDYVRGIHSVRTGLLFNGGRYRSDDRTNYLGTYTFESLEAFTAGRPRSYTRRIGDPRVEYASFEAGWYLQDDIRVNRGLTLSPGIRVEAQTHVDDVSNVGPRFGVTWAPFRSGKTSLRASAGMFYDWMGANVYEQTLRVDGFRQQELNIINPSYPDPGMAGGIPPIARYLLDDKASLGSFRRLSAGIDQTLTSQIRVNATYAYTRGTSIWRGRNLNTPINGVRSNPAFANIVEVTSDGTSRQHALTTSFTLNLARAQAQGPLLLNGVPLLRDGPVPPPAGPAGAAAPLWDWRRLALNGFYSVGTFDNNSDGAFSLPATGSIDDDWGPAPQDVRHRVVAGLSSTQLRNLSLILNVNASSGAPYSIRTGGDDNGDQVFNDRPAGIGRNSLRAGNQFTLNMTAIYVIPFGKGTPGGPPGVGIIIPAPGAAPQVTAFAPPPARFRLQLILSAINVTNHANYGGYSGTMTSPFYRQPTLVTNPRKIDVGIGFTF